MKEKNKMVKKLYKKGDLVYIPAQESGFYENSKVFPKLTKEDCVIMEIDYIHRYKRYKDEIYYGGTIVDLNGWSEEENYIEGEPDIDDFFEGFIVGKA